jgi:polar amino acid transport system substrate-binding protein
MALRRFLGVSSIMISVLLTSGIADARASSIELNQPGTLTVCTVDSTPPMSTVVDGKLVGYDISFTKEIARRLNLTPKFRLVIFEAIFASVANHNCDISAGSTSITLPRLKIVNFSRPYFVGSYTILDLANGPVKTERDLAKKRLGVVAASIQEAYATETYKETTIVPFPDTTALKISLLAGQIDAAFFDGSLAAIYLKDTSAPLRIVISIPNTDQPAGLGIAKDRPKLLAAVNDAINAMIEDGTYMQIYQNTLGGSAPQLPGPDFKPTR